VQDEILCKWVTFSPSLLRDIPKLTTTQKELGMSRILLIMAGQVFDFHPFPSIFKDQHQKRFYRLQSLYQEYSIIDTGHIIDKKPNILSLSPRMEIQSEERCLLKNLFSEHLENLAKKAEEELQQELAEEILQAAVLEERKKKVRQRRKYRKKKKIQSNNIHTPKSSIDIALKNINLIQNDESSSVDQKESQKFKFESNEDALKDDSIAYPKQFDSDNSEDFLPRFLLPRKNKILDDSSRNATDPSKDSLVKHKEDNLSSKNSMQLDYMDSLQQVQLKAYIAETKAMAAEERAEKLEGLLKEIITDDSLVSKMNEELRDRIRSMIRIDCAKGMYS